MPQVAIFIGSISDKPSMLPCVELLQQLDITFKFTVCSAHRTPERTERLIGELEESGCQVYICAAGLAAHLAGAVAARTIKPVIGVPLVASGLGGMDALLSTVMMPPGFPVATVATDKVGAKNAAWLAAQILALQNSALAQRLHDARLIFIADVEEAAAELAEEI